MPTVPAVDLHDDVLANDWLGFAAYLADAVDDDVLDLTTAQIELAIATDPDELDALQRAIDVAREHFGTDATATTLLRDAFACSAVDRVA